VGWWLFQGASIGEEGQEVISDFYIMIFDWPFGTICAILIYIGLVYIAGVFLRFGKLLCPYEFEVLHALQEQKAENLDGD